jgi:hypothetical protein
MNAPSEGESHRIRDSEIAYLPPRIRRATQCVDLLRKNKEFQICFRRFHGLLSAAWFRKLVNKLHIRSLATIFMEETIWKARPYTAFPPR